MASFAITAVIFGFGYAALSSMRTFALAQAFGMKSLGSANGLLSWIELPFAALASPIAGFVFDATGSYDGAFLVFAGFLMIGRVREGHEQATVHAEQNAISDAARRGVSLDGACVYITHYPCINCAKILAAAGIAQIKYYHDYRNDALVKDLLLESGVDIEKL